MAAWDGVGWSVESGRVRCHLTAVNGAEILRTGLGGVCVMELCWVGLFTLGPERAWAHAIVTEMGWNGPERIRLDYIRTAGMKEIQRENQGTGCGVCMGMNTPKALVLASSVISRISKSG